MAKCHISDDGVARICNPLKTGKCKFGDDKPHFETKAHNAKYCSQKCIVGLIVQGLLNNPEKA